MKTLSFERAAFIEWVPKSVALKTTQPQANPDLWISFAGYILESKGLSSFRTLNMGWIKGYKTLCEAVYHGTSIRLSESVGWLFDITQHALSRGGRKTKLSAIASIPWVDRAYIPSRWQSLALPWHRGLQPGESVLGVFIDSVSGIEQRQD